MSDAAVPGRYKHWLVLSTVAVLVSLVVFSTSVIAGFVYFNAAATPMWVTVAAVLGILGMVVGFAGLFLILVVAGASAWQHDKRRAAARR